MSIRSTTAKALPYVIVAVAIAAQGALVAFIVKVIATAWLNVPAFGGWLAWTLFVFGGFGLGLIELRIVHEGERVSDPLYRFCCWAQRKLGLLGFAINSVILGSMGASIALKREGHPHPVVWSFAAAVLYATVWIPLYLTVLQ